MSEILKSGYKPKKPAEKEELSYFLNRQGCVQFYKKCVECEHSCKQSYKIKGLKCSKFSKFKTEEEYKRK